MTAFQDSLAALTQAWETSPEPSAKISSYFPVYVRLFDHLRGTPCVFIETGVLDGGSLFMWRRWLGKQATIVGVDLNPDASKWRTAGFRIFTGDQGDRSFWRRVFHELGRFDALLDDGGHLSFQQIVTVQEALRFARAPCTLAVEDTSTSFMRDFGGPSDSSFLEFCKAATDCLVARSFGLYPDRLPTQINSSAIDAFASVFSIQFFNGIVSFHVDPGAIAESRLVRNNDSRSAADFRYNGIGSATIDWPNVLTPERRTIDSQAKSS
jgi:hypothetical protein